MPWKQMSARFLSCETMSESTANSSDRMGAYGLVLDHAFAGGDWWNVAGDRWERWSFEWMEQPAGLSPPEIYDDDRIRLRLRPDGSADISRRMRSTILGLPNPPSNAALIHPLVGTTAIVNAYWSGWNAFHAGGFVLDGRVWGVIGHREMGKSSTLAWLYANGFTVFSDDIIVLDGLTSLAGPRCMDLREPAAHRFGLGADIGVVGARRRWRVQLPPVTPQLPFGGWIVLRWSERLQVSSVAASQRLQVLAAGRALLRARPTPDWLDLIALPMVSLGRPRNWSHQDNAMDCLLSDLRRY
jgi:hypothetical protein